MKQKTSMIGWKTKRNEMTAEKLKTEIISLMNKSFNNDVINFFCKFHIDIIVSWKSFVSSIISSWYFFSLASRDALNCLRLFYVKIKKRSFFEPQFIHSFYLLVFTSYEERESGEPECLKGGVVYLNTLQSRCRKTCVLVSKRYLLLWSTFCMLFQYFSAFLTLVSR